MLLTCLAKRSPLIAILKPGMDSNLSSVPPVWPKPRPLSFAKVAPQAATIGPKTKDVLSPTPPVLCLSTFTPFKLERSSVSPECSIKSVKLITSSSVIPLNKIAIAIALV